MLLDLEEWHAALWGVREFGLIPRLSPIPIVERALQQGAWAAAVFGLRVFHLERGRFKGVASNRIDEVIRTRKLDEIIEALDSIAAFDLHDDLAVRLAEGFHRDRSLMRTFLEIWTQEDPEYASLGRGLGVWGRIVRFLLVHFRDVDAAEELLAPLGVSRQQIEHNLGQIERTELLNQMLTETGGLPDDLAPNQVELLGYVHATKWILAPGFYDFYISPTEKAERPVGRVVPFRLTVDWHPGKERPVLNAVHLVPVSAD